MFNLFVNDTDEIKIELTVARDNKGRIYANQSAEELEELLKDVDHKSELISVVFKRPCYEDIVNLSNQNFLSENGLVINPIAERKRKMVTLIKSWTIKGADGKEVQPTPEAIGKLEPVIADTIAILLNAEIGVSY